MEKSDLDLPHSSHVGWWIQMLAVFGTKLAHQITEQNSTIFPQKALRRNIKQGSQ